MEITINYRFTSLNDYILAERTNRHVAAKIKRQETLAAQLAANGKDAWKMYPADVTFYWHCADGRTDPDNISFAQKFILDGLVNAGVLLNDGWKQIGSIRHEFIIDKYNEFVVVELK